jgi:hypothetical protein
MAMNTDQAVAAAADLAVPLADTVVLTLAPSKRLASTCSMQAAVSFAGRDPLPGYEVTFEVVSGPNAGWTSPPVLSAGANGIAVVSVPRPLTGSQPNVIRATLHSFQLFVSNTVDCPSSGVTAATSVAAIGIACPPTPQPC